MKTIDELLDEAREAIANYPCKMAHMSTEENAAINALKAWVRLRQRWINLPGGFNAAPKEEQNKYIEATRKLMLAGETLLIDVSDRHR